MMVGTAMPNFLLIVSAFREAHTPDPTEVFQILTTGPTMFGLQGVQNLPCVPTAPIEFQEAER